MALFRNPFVYCCVYIHPQAFYKILLYCILLSYTCYSLRALFTVITHCVSVCVIWKLFGARRINHDRNKPDRVFLKKNLHRLLRACHGNLIPSRREVIDVCSQRELMRLHKALAESRGEARRPGCCSSHSLTRLQASPADSPISSRTDRQARA